MNTIAWVLVMVAALIIRQVSKGRVMNVGEDISDAFLAIVKGDTKGLSEVLSRTGDSTDPAIGNLGTALGEATVGVAEGVGLTAGATGAAVGAAVGKLQDSLNKSVALAAATRGAKAKGYRWAASGPDYYDCSGLMWRACQDVGFKGGRFTTFTIGATKGFRKLGAPNPAVQGPGVGGSSVTATVGDLVVWPTHHMGVVVGPDLFYSARNPQAGISTAKISSFRKDAPVYYRLMAN